MSEYIKKEDALKPYTKESTQIWMDDVYNYLNGLQSYSFPDREKGEWIPTSERNPDIYKRAEKYLITDDVGQVRTACFTNSGEACWWTYPNVVAWQPLPEPYKEGGNE